MGIDTQSIVRSIVGDEAALLFGPLVLKVVDVANIEYSTTWFKSVQSSFYTKTDSLPVCGLGTDHHQNAAGERAL